MSANTAFGFVKKTPHPDRKAEESPPAAQMPRTDTVDRGIGELEDRDWFMRLCVYPLLGLVICCLVLLAVALGIAVIRILFSTSR